MSPEYEGPEDEGQDAVAPRRVKHLILLPGGGAPDDPSSPAMAASTGTAALLPGSEWEGDRDDDLATVFEDAEPPQAAQAWGPGVATGVATGVASGGGALAAAAQVAEALPLDAHPGQSLRLKLRVISQSVTSPKAPGMPFIIFASVLVSAAIFGLVVLRVMVDQASFRVDSLETQVTRQQAQLRHLHYAVSAQEAPGRIAALAAQAGLVPGSQMQTLVGAGQAAPTATAAAAPAASTSQSPRSTSPPASSASSPASSAAASPASGGTGPPPVTSGQKAKTAGSSTPARTTTGTAGR